jgi:hypothetical protein
MNSHNCETHSITDGQSKVRVLVQPTSCFKQYTLQFLKFSFTAILTTLCCLSCAQCNVEVKLPHKKAWRLTGEDGMLGFHPSFYTCHNDDSKAVSST